jgi:hypothetical protein
VAAIHLFSILSAVHDCLHWVTDPYYHIDQGCTHLFDNACCQIGGVSMRMIIISLLLQFNCVHWHIDVVGGVLMRMIVVLT